MDPLLSIDYAFSNSLYMNVFSLLSISLPLAQERNVLYGLSLNPFPNIALIAHLMKHFRVFENKSKPGSECSPKLEVLQDSPFQKKKKKRVNEFNAETVERTEGGPKADS